MIYVASSWRCPIFRSVINGLKSAGIEHYDFQHDGAAFDWSDVDRTWDSQAHERNRYTMREMGRLMRHPLSKRGFAADSRALRHATATLLVLPCGKSAHLELGYSIGRGIPTAVLSLETEEPELMYSFCDLLDNIADAVMWCRDNG